jgi:hypothetical protein
MEAGACDLGNAPVVEHIVRRTAQHHEEPVFVTNIVLPKIMDRGLFTDFFLVELGRRERHTASRAELEKSRVQREAGSSSQGYAMPGLGKSSKPSNAQRTKAFASIGVMSIRRESDDGCGRENFRRLSWTSGFHACRRDRNPDGAAALDRTLQEARRAHLVDQRIDRRERPRPVLRHDDVLRHVE